MNVTIDAILVQLAAEPHNCLHRLVLADALEEAGDTRFEEVRDAVPSLDGVIQRLWPGASCEWVSGPDGARGEIRHRPFGRLLATSQYLHGQIQGDFALRDPEIARAAEIERAVAVLHLFGREEKPRPRMKKQAPTWTSFADGPAKGKALTLARSPVFLRVVVALNDGRVDALDQLSDEAEHYEAICAYCLVPDSRGSLHIDGAGPRGQRIGEWYRTATYALCASQPPDAMLRDRASWQQWATAQFARRQGGG